MCRLKLDLHSSCLNVTFFYSHRVMKHNHAVWRFSVLEVYSLNKYYWGIFLLIKTLITAELIFEVCGNEDFRCTYYWAVCFLCTSFSGDLWELADVVPTTDLSWKSVCVVPGAPAWRCSARGKGWLCFPCQLGPTWGGQLSRDKILLICLPWEELVLKYHKAKQPKCSEMVC